MNDNNLKYAKSERKSNKFEITKWKQIDWKKAEEFVNRLQIRIVKAKRYKAMPTRRIYIKKPNGKLRPLSIPTMKDRAMQILYLLALQPIAETNADKGSFGFRMYRGCQEAMERIFTVLSHKNAAEWILEGDIKGCFDNTK